jgi:hypothetical protein
MSKGLLNTLAGMLKAPIQVITQEGALIARYRAIRALGKTYQTQVIPLVTPRINEFARDFGLLTKQGLAMKHEFEMEFLLDYAVHHPYAGFRNAADYMVRKNLIDGMTPDEQDFFRADAQVTYSIHKVIDTKPGLGVTLQDIITNEEKFVVDLHGSSSHQVGLHLGARIRTIAGLHHTTGTGLYTTPELLDEYKKQVSPRLRAQWEKTGIRLSPSDQAALNARVFKLAAESGLLDRMRTAPV